MRRVLVTGGDGFIGRHACAALRDLGFEVQIAGRGTGEGRHRLDLLTDDPAPLIEALQPTHLLHLAWTAKPGVFWNDPANADWVEASLRLARAFADAGGERFVGAGTCAEYDWSYDLLDERETPLAPHTVYGAAKVDAFQRLGAMAERLNFAFAWGRVFFLYGPDEAPGRLVSGLIDSLRVGTPFETSEGRQERDFMHVADVGAAFAALVDSDVQGAVNIASGTSRPVRDVVQTAADLLGRSDLVRFGARPAQAGEPPVMAAKVQRLRDEVGFTARYNLEDGLADAVAGRPRA